jgi:bifunctional non-homologous end joining protein LigD
MPTGIKPMLCTLLKAPFNDSKYLYEVKWDGYRIIAYKEERMVRLESRGGLDYTKKYPPVVNALLKLRDDVVFDGEVVVLNEEGRPDFDALQKASGKQYGIYYYVFDILWQDGQNLMQLPLEERKEILCDVVKDNPAIKFSDHFDDGLTLFKQVQAMKLEGIVAKRRDSQYQPNKRGKEWYKIPTEIKQEFVIGGWIESDSRHFRTLLFGAYEGKKLKWVGHAGGGYKDNEMPSILHRLKALEIKTSPFDNTVDYDGIPHWVKPILVANIKYATVTKSGKIRKPAIFQGFREDKQAAQVVVERVAQVTDSLQEKILSKVKLVTSADSNWPAVERIQIRHSDTVVIDDSIITLSNVDTELWSGVTKADVIQYYHSISRYILPHLKDRPLSLHIKLKGPHAPGVYIKDMEGRQPDFAEIFTTERKHKKKGKRNIIDYLVCNNIPTLLYMVNLGCIDINPWTSQTLSPTGPNYIIIDLDPSDGDFSKAIESAKASKDFFDRCKVKAFIKTSGKTGMHIFLPCSSFSFPEARIIAENICAEVQSTMPSITTTSVNIASRGSRLYLDPNQNDYADTVAAPYSIRPYKHPNVSTPIDWKELTTELAPENFTIKNIVERLKKKGDLFKPVLDKKIALKNDEVLKKIL